MREPLTVCVRNITRDTVIAPQARLAESFTSRLRGLLGKSARDFTDALLIRPCNMVHMIGMRFPLDVLYVSKQGEVLACVANLRPWAIGPYVRGANWVLELPAGALANSGTQVGDRLETVPTCLPSP